MDISIFEIKYPWDIVLKNKNKEITKRINNEVVNITTGEILNNPAIVIHKRYDSEKFTKIYQGLINVKYGFKPATQKIVDYIIANIPINEPILILNLNILTTYFTLLNNAVKLTKNKKIMSRQTYAKCLQELQKNEIIGKTGHSEIWWINANIIHNGSRLIIAEIIEKIKLTEQSKMEKAGQQRLID